MNRAFTLEDFVRESNRIEGIHRKPTATEINAHRALLQLNRVEIGHLEGFVMVVQPGAKLRATRGMNVRVADHRPWPGGPWVVDRLDEILNDNVDPFIRHQWYETLHPFMDGNGRSGRALWLHDMGGIDRAPLGFLHHWYYQSLDDARIGISCEGLPPEPGIHNWDTKQGNFRTCSWCGILHPYDDYDLGINAFKPKDRQ